MLNQLWSNAVADPPLTWAFLILAFAVAVIVSVFVQAWLENRRSRITTAGALRRDQHVAERRAKLRLLQGKCGRRRAS